MIGKIFTIVLLALVSSESLSAATSNFVCYHGSWAHYRTNNGHFGVSSIDTSHCTHLIYSFIGLGTDGTVHTLDEWLDFGLNNLNKFTALKSARSDLKVLVAIGGWSHSSTFPAVAASASARAVFLQSALEFIQTHGFDGFDFDWEYPNQRGGTAVDVENFVTLLQEFKAAFEPLGLLVTAAVSASPSSVSLSYNVPGIAQHLDMINVMTYDLHGSWDGVTGHNAPLYASSLDTTPAALELNLDAAITNWIAQGAPPSKINLGIPFYGRTFTLASTNDVSLGAATSNGGTAGTYTQESGYLGYNEIVELLLSGGWQYIWDHEQQVPHMYKGNQWVGFDDPTSITLKVKYAQSKGLGGVMVWAIETDDHVGLSGVKNPLLTAISTQLAAGSPNSPSAKPTTTGTTKTKKTTPATTTSSTTSTTSTTTTVGPVTNSGHSSNTCNKDGFIRDSNNCNKFYQCLEKPDGTYSTYAFSCSAGLSFDLITHACNWKALVTDCSS